MARGRGSHPAKNTPKLEDQLALVHWIAREFGYESAGELRKDLHEGVVEPGFDSSGRSFVALRLLSRGSRLRMSEDDLRCYDDNIRRHLAPMNARRTAHPITLRYFQHFAALAAERFLHCRAESRASLLASLNKSVSEERSAFPQRADELPGFEERDLDRLALWMATGSGKTLLLHLNYRQFLHYDRKARDNILLVTPNEGLSAQHLREAQLSGIPVRRFDDPVGLQGTNALSVIEITKLVEEKRGGGVSVPVESFEGRNLIFVDEGHKGSGGEAWRKVREALAETGFTFEYSATFGQALAAAKDADLTARYGRTILYDYSYRWFYEDGYGKDFRVLNLERDASGVAGDALLLAGLLAFYEQRLAFDDGGHGPYGVESPLWVFVGAKVNAVHSEGGQDRSDVLTVCRFFYRFLNDRAWAAATIANILNGTIGSDLGGTDPFHGLFPRLREEELARGGALYEDILKRVFHALGSGGLELHTIRSGDGEIGLRAAGAGQRDYFGVIYVGDSPKFLNLVRSQEPSLTVGEDVIAEALFDAINDPRSPVNVLVGAKRFIEGWNSWRVSSMGLLNIGRSEGSQIIQLFGRGVRLRGKDFCLKRSRALAANGHPPYLHLLETLQVFAIRASYMENFRKYLRAEGITEPREFVLPFHIRDGFLDEGLVVPRLPDDVSFAQSAPPFMFTDEDSAAVLLDLAPRLSGFRSSDDEIAAATEFGAREPRKLSDAALDLVDWQCIRLELLEHAYGRGYRNIIVRESDLRPIAKSCKLAAEESLFDPQNMADLERLQDAVTGLLRKALDTAYRRRKEQWETTHLRYRPVTASDPNLTAGENAAYTIRVPNDGTHDDFIAELEQFLATGQSLRDPRAQGLRRLRSFEFDGHLYEPLLGFEGDDLTMSPPGLVKSEEDFVRDLSAFWSVATRTSHAGVSLFLLRNLSRGSGIGFFEDRGFYPDFILWIKKENRQHIVFVEPHGMFHAPAYEHDEKARLHERLRDEIGPTLDQGSGFAGVTLDSYIISATPFETLRRQYDDGTWTRECFAEKHILFPESPPAYLRRILDDQLGRSAGP